jgi:hypothetical protein
VLLLPLQVFEPSLGNVGLELFRFLLIQIFLEELFELFDL